MGKCPGRGDLGPSCISDHPSTNVDVKIPNPFLKQPPVIFGQSLKGSAENSPKSHFCFRLCSMHCFKARRLITTQMNKGLSSIKNNSKIYTFVFVTLNYGWS